MKNSRSELLVIDPWAISGLDEYTEGLLKGLKFNGQKITLITNVHSPVCVSGIKIYKIFFPVSQRMRKKTLSRKIIRYLEYLFAWFLILIGIIIDKYKTIHFQWLLEYKTDLFFIRLLKKANPKAKYVLTAHNVLPHNDGSKYIPRLAKLYSEMDKIIVHGELLKKDFLKVFPEYPAINIFVSRHGAKRIKIDSNIYVENQHFNTRIQRASKVFLFLGLLNFNKGVDILIESWLRANVKDEILIIAGQKENKYDELNKLEERIAKTESIIYLPKFLEPEFVNYLFSISTVVLLPYRNGSVSGVLFNAAFFRKPVLATKFGSIAEYIIPNETGFIIDDLKELDKALEILFNLDSQLLKKIGQKNFEHIKKNFDWNAITEEIIENCYS